MNRRGFLATGVAAVLAKVADKFAVPPEPPAPFANYPKLLGGRPPVATSGYAQVGDGVAILSSDNTTVTTSFWPGNVSEGDCVYFSNNYVVSNNLHYGPSRDGRS